MASLLWVVFCLYPEFAHLRGYSTNEVRYSMRVPCRTFVVVFHRQPYYDILPLLAYYRKVRSSTIDLELLYFVYFGHFLLLVSGITTLFFLYTLEQNCINKINTKLIRNWSHLQRQLSCCGLWIVISQLRSRLFSHLFVNIASEKVVRNYFLIFVNFKICIYVTYRERTRQNLISFL